MKTYSEDEQVNFQVNAIKSMLNRSLSDLEIAAKLNEINEPNLKGVNTNWLARDVREIINNFKLESVNSPINDGINIGSGVQKYRLVNTLNLSDIFVQIILWIILSIVTLGLALPFYAYYFLRILINSTEVQEIK